MTESSYVGFLFQTHDCSNANNKMWTHVNERLDTNSTIIIVFVNR